MEGQPTTGSAQPVQGQTAAPAPAPKKRSWLLVCGIIALILLVCCGISAGTGLIAINAVMKEAKSELTKQLCDKTADDFNKLYNTATTENLRMKMSAEEFSQQMDMFGDNACDSLKNGSIITQLSQNWSVQNMTTNGVQSMVIKGAPGNVKVSIEFTGTGDDMKINDLSVTKK